MSSFKSLEKVHSMFLEPLVIGTTFSGSPSIFIIFAGLSRLTQNFPSLRFIEIFTTKLSKVHERGLQESQTIIGKDNL